MTKLRTFLTGLMGYIHIVLFPLLIALIISIVVYLTMPALLGVAISAFLCLCGLITGLIMSIVILKRRGPAAFIKTEELNEIVQEEEDLNQL